MYNNVVVDPKKLISPTSPPALYATEYMDTGLSRSDIEKSMKTRGGDSVGIDIPIFPGDWRLDDSVYAAESDFLEYDVS